MRWDPYRDFGFPAFLGPIGEAGFMPAFEVKETDKAYVFKADLPGVKEEDLDLSLTGNRLTVSGRREEEKRDENERYFTCERSYGSFSRTFTLPGGIDANQVQAELKEGVLTVSVPKTPETQARRIQIQARGKGDKGKAEA